MALVPSAQLTTYTPGTRTGVPGGIAQYQIGGASARTNLIDVTASPYNADNTGGSSALSAINAAIAAAAANDVVYIPTGTYDTDGQLNISSGLDHITIRGDGPGATILLKAAITGGASDGWTAPSTPANVTAGLSKDSTSITLDDATGFTVGVLMLISFENQTDDTAIQAGAIPNVSVGGDYQTRRYRKQVTRITAKSGNVLTISPGIYHTPDAGLGAIAQYAQLQNDGIGIEDLTIDMTGSSAVFPIQMPHCYGSWVKNVEISHMSNYGVELVDSLQCEIRHAYIHERNLSGSNGAGILCNTISGCLIEDNILYDLAPCMEVNFGSAGNAFLYNAFENPPHTGAIALGVDTNHGPHNALNLYEGNFTPQLECDGYFGGASEDVIFRNWIPSSSMNGTVCGSMLLKRFTRKYAVIGNVLGKNGVAQGDINCGEPNIGNSDSIGTAQPSTGDFWEDWEAAATLTTRGGNTSGTLTLSKGSVAAGQRITIYWNSGLNSQTFTAATSVAGVVTWGDSDIDVNAHTDNLPIATTALTVGAQVNGFQELDLDVEATTIDKGNYIYGASGAAGSMSSLGGDTLPTSYAYAAKPGWWDDDGTLAWPPFDPTSPDSANYSNTPAGARLLALLPATAPTITSAASKKAYFGEAFTYQITTDTTTDSYAASGLPGWASINTVTGAITGTPNAEAVSTVTLTATNATGTSDDFTFTLTALGTRRATITCATQGAVTAAVATSPFTISGEYDGRG